VHEDGEGQSERVLPGSGYYRIASTSAAATIAYLSNEPQPGIGSETVNGRKLALAVVPAVF
jgi:hypothetical protein